MLFRTLLALLLSLGCATTQLAPTSGFEETLDVYRLSRGKKALALAVDEIAERIRALGMPAPGSYREFVELASVAEAEGGESADEMIRQLVVGQETVVRTAREIFATAAAASDEPTADLLTQRMQVHEKTAWMLRSLLE